MTEYAWEYAKNIFNREQILLHRDGELIAQIGPVKRRNNGRIGDRYPLLVICTDAYLDDVYTALDTEGLLPEDVEFMQKHRDDFKGSPREDYGHGCPEGTKRHYCFFGRKGKQERAELRWETQNPGSDHERRVLWRGDTRLATVYPLIRDDVGKLACDPTITIYRGNGGRKGAVFRAMREVDGFDPEDAAALRGMKDDYTLSFRRDDGGNEYVTPAFLEEAGDVLENLSGDIAESGKTDSDSDL